MARFRVCQLNIGAWEVHAASVQTVTREHFGFKASAHLEEPTQAEPHVLTWTVLGPPLPHDPRRRPILGQILGYINPTPGGQP